MSNKNANPYAALERLFHEPNRLAIMSALCGAEGGMAFGELKDVCDLTDGNLSRHLKALQTERAVRIKKHFVGVRPRTTVFVTASGRDGFMAYLKALEKVLKKAAKSIASDSKKASTVGLKSRPAEV